MNTILVACSSAAFGRSRPCNGAAVGVAKPAFQTFFCGVCDGAVGQVCKETPFRCANTRHSGHFCPL